MDCISSEAIELFTLLGGARQSDTEDMTVQLFSKMEVNGFRIYKLSVS